MRRRAVAACDHSHLIDQIRHYEQRDERFEQAVEDLMEPHRPGLIGDGIRAGNSHDNVPFYCEVCRTPWPCRTFNDLRCLYGVVNDWERAARPYAPLLLHLEEVGGEVEQP